MNITIPDSLNEFVTRETGAGHFADADAFVADLIRREAEVVERTRRGEPFVLDEHFERRLERMLDEVENDECVSATSEDFDAMEREALDLIRQRQSR